MRLFPRPLNGSACGWRGCPSADGGYEGKQQIIQEVGDPVLVMAVPIAVTLAFAAGACISSRTKVANGPMLRKPLRTRRSGCVRVRSEEPTIPSCWTALRRSRDVVSFSFGVDMGSH